MMMGSGNDCHCCKDDDSTKWTKGKAGSLIYRIVKTSTDNTKKDDKSPSKSKAGELYLDQKDKMCPENWTLGTKMSDVECAKKVSLYDINKCPYMVTNGDNCMCCKNQNKMYDKAGYKIYKVER